MNRRAMHCHNRRKVHTVRRRTGIINQNIKSASEGPDDSGTAQKAVKAQKARRA